MTFRELLGTLLVLSADSDDAVLDRQVILRIGVPNGDDDEDIHVGGLQSAVVDAGCTDEDALTLGADQDGEDEFEVRCFDGRPADDEP